MQSASYTIHSFHYILNMYTLHFTHIKDFL